MKFDNQRSKLLLTTAICGAMAISNVSQAQDEEANDFGGYSFVLEEIIVTAQKREENLQDVSVAVTAFSGDQIKAYGFRESMDIALMTPGVHISGSWGGQLLSFNIRGVAQNDFVDTAESPNAVYVDDAYIALMSAQRFPMFDLERVEVLKGPQGTLFGRNATGGLSHFITKRPTEEFEAFADVTYGSYDQMRFEGAAGGAITDGFRVRMAGYFNKHDPILTNTFATGEGEMNDDTVALRLHAELDLSDSATLLLTGAMARSDISSVPYLNTPTTAVFNEFGQMIDTIATPAGDTRNGIGPDGINFCPSCFTVTPERPVPGGDLYGYLGSDPENLEVSKNLALNKGSEYDMDSITAHFSWDGDNIGITSVTDYRTGTKSAVLDTDAGPYTWLDTFSDVDYKQFSEELRFDGSTDNMQWQAGVFFLDYSISAVSGLNNKVTQPGENVLLHPAFGVAGVAFTNILDLDTQSWSVFGQVDYDLSDTLTAVAGARYIREKKDYMHQVDLFLADSGDYLFPFTPDYQESTSDGLWSAKAQLEWRPNDDVLVYAGVNRGIKAGSFNQDLGGLSGGIGPGTLIPASYGEEVLYAYEVGFKATVADGRGRVNGSVYYYDYKDFQAFRYEDFATFVTNEDATFKGAELEVAFNPVARLDVLASVSYLDTKVKDVYFGAGAKDVRSAYSPEFQAMALARYTVPLADGLLAFQGTVTHSSNFYASLTNFSSTLYPSYTLGDLKVSYTSGDENWSVEGYVKNVTDERYRTVGIDISNLGGYTQYAVGTPRWFGVNLRMYFN